MSVIARHRRMAGSDAHSGPTREPALRSTCVPARIAVLEWGQSFQKFLNRSGAISV